MGPAETIENGAVFDRFGAVFNRLGIVFDCLGAETKHLNSTRTARPPKGPGSSSRIQILKSSVSKIDFLIAFPQEIPLLIIS